MEYENYSDDDSNDPLDDWNHPIPLAIGKLTLPIFEEMLIPEEILDYVETIATDTQTAIEAITVAVIQAVSVILGTKFCIFAKQRKNWYEVAPLWMIIGARSGTRKTNIYKAIKSLLSGITDKYEAENNATEMDYETQVDSLNNQIMAGQALVKKGGANVKQDIENLTAIQAQLRQLTKNKYPVKRLTTDDATIEKVQEMCVDNKNGIGIMRDELSGVFAAMSKNGHQNDRDFYLAGYNCTDSFTIDRIIRGTRKIKRLCVSLSGFIQPSVLSNNVTEMIKSGFDGFPSRFLLTLFPKRVAYDGTDIAPDEEAIAQMKANVEFLEQWIPEEDENALLYRQTIVNSEIMLGVKFGTVAQTIFNDFDQRFEDMISEQDAELEDGSFNEDPVFQAMLEHKAKYKTLALKLCLVFHVLKHIGSGSITHLVDEITLVRALAWTEYLEPHAAYMYAKSKGKPVEDTDKVTPVAIAILKKIAVGSIQNGMTAANIKSKGWAGIKDKALIEQALEKLAQHYWIDYSEQVSGNNGGINSKKVTVNPKSELLLGNEMNYTELTNQYNQNQYYHRSLKQKLVLIRMGKSYVDVKTGELMPKL